MKRVRDLCRSETPGVAQRLVTGRASPVSDAACSGDRHYICERVLKKAILHRKNAYFYKTLAGAHVGDIFMSLIHTCELNRVPAFDYLVELQRHEAQVKEKPSEWMPWNYRETLAGLASTPAVS